MRSLSFTLTLLLTLSCSNPSDLPSTGDAAQRVESTVANASPERFKEHVTYLASDDLLGREPGTPGYTAAARYVADQFESLGLKPGAEDGTYYQQVPLRRGVRDKTSIALTVVDESGAHLELVENVDFAVRGSVRNANMDLTAPIVFAGYGITVPAENRDDYAGVDVEGKVVALLGNTPTHLESEQRAYYGAQKIREASERGAIGVIYLTTPTTEAMFPFTRMIESGALDSPYMAWVRPDGEVFTRAPNIRGGASFSIPGAQKLMTAAGKDWDALVAASQEGKGTMPAFETGLTLTVRASSSLSNIESPNVVALVPGTDPELQDEVVVLTAHLDHLGVSPIDAEDTINNGALDNAAGVATLIEAARLLIAGPPPRRSVMFLAVTAEEQGLLGAQYFATYPTLPKESLVANINLDMPLLTYDFQDVIVFGGARSTLKNAIEAAAASIGIDVSPDPFPEQGLFTRSDHYRFVEEGIPSVMLSTGFANGGDKAFNHHLQTHYHQPSDDLNLPIDWNAGAKFAELKTRILQTVANADERPVWNKSDFFGEKFNGPMAE